MLVGRARLFAIAALVVITLGGVAALFTAGGALATAGTTERVSVASDGTQGNNNSNYPSLSLDGRYVAFGSDASNLVPSDTNTVRDIFVRDRGTGP